MERVLIGVLSVLLGGAVPAWSAGLGVVFRDTVVLGGSATDQNTNVFTVTGMSGLMHVGGSSFLAVMDNSDKLLEVDVTLDGLGNIVSSSITGGLTLTGSRMQTRCVTVCF